MSNFKEFLKRKDIVITPQRYLIEALGAMAQGLFASLLIGTIIKTLGQQTGLEVLVDLGGYATAMSGPAMACAIGWALHCPPLVLFSLITVGYSANALGGAGGPLAVLIIAIVAAELGKAVSKETKVDILVTPLVTIFVGVGLSMLIAAPIGAAASQVGTLIMWATEQAPLVMGILVSVIVGVALTLPISSAAICAALGLTGLAGGAAVAGCCAQMVGFAVMSYQENGVGGLVSQGPTSTSGWTKSVPKIPLGWRGAARGFTSTSSPCRAGRKGWMPHGRPTSNERKEDVPMVELLMFLYGVDADQAAARCPAAWFGVIVMVIGVLGWLDYYGCFDSLGRWLGKGLKEVRDVFSV